MTTFAGDDEREHRRGFVMGLTMAEAMLLLVFVLLLALAAVASEMERKAAAAEERAGSLSRELAGWQRVEDLLAPDDTKADSGNTGEGSAAVVQRLARAEADRAELAAARRRIDELENRLAEARRTSAENGGIEAIVEAAARLDPSVPAAVSLKKGLEALTENAEKEKAAPSIAAEADLIRDQREELVRLAEVNRKLVDRVRLLGLQNESLRQGGLTSPSCWIGNDGEAEYLFDLTITDSGIVVRDIAPAHRREDPARALIEPFAAGTSLSAARFRAMTGRLFRWSRTKRCRFYVWLGDATSPSSKELYQKLRRAVEGHFYIHHRW